MPHTRSYSDTNKTAVPLEQAGQEFEPEVNYALAGQGSGGAAWGADTAGADDTAAALHRVTAGIREGISPLQFMDSIAAGNRKLGNRDTCTGSDNCTRTGREGRPTRLRHKACKVRAGP